MLRAPVRWGSTGALQAPASGTITIERPDGTELVSGAAVTVSSSIATYTVTPSASETLGAGWTVAWSLTMTDGVLPWREESYLCEYVPPNVVSAADLYRAQPELRHRVPEAQGDDGTAEGWQPQIDQAYDELLEMLVNDGRRPWEIRSVSSYHRWLVARAVQIALGTIPSAMGDSWSEARKAAHFEVTAARGDLRIQYADQPATVRRAGASTIRLAPVGRSPWA